MGKSNLLRSETCTFSQGMREMKHSYTLKLPKKSKISSQEIQPWPFPHKNGRGKRLHGPGGPHIKTGLRGTSDLVMPSFFPTASHLPPPASFPFGDSTYEYSTLSFYSHSQASPSWAICLKMSRYLPQPRRAERPFMPFKWLPRLPKAFLRIRLIPKKDG